MEALHRFLHCGNTRAQIQPFQARGHFDVALQILAQNFGLTGQLGDVATEPRVAVPPAGLTSSVLLIASSEARLAIRKTHAQRVRTVIDDDGIRGGFAIHDGGSGHSELIR
jgi:hypothetical protein